MKNRKQAAFFSAAALIFFAACVVPAYGGDNGAGKREDLSFFFSPSCHECRKVKDELLSRVVSMYGSRLNVDYRDISQPENYKRLFELARKHGKKDGVKVPAVYFHGHLLVGSQDLREQLERLAEQNVPAPSGGTAAAYEPLSHFRSFTPLAVSFAGLVDGINPCAFTVIVFFVSFLSLQGFRKGILAAIGLSFILGVFLTYLLLGLGVFGFFYRFSGFWKLRAAFNWTAGGLSLLLGTAAVIDAFRYKRNGRAEGMILSLPQAVKNRIHAVIGERYRGERARNRAPARLMMTALITGFLVSLLEAVCTGQVYLPTIVFVLKSTTFKLAAFGYLVLYNVMFIVPLAVVLLLAVKGVTSGQFARFMSRHFIAVKALMASLFFFLGIFLIWRG